MRILRTPDGAADGLPDFDVEHRFVTIPDTDGGTMRILDAEAGDPAGPPIVFLHGNPSWSYIWRQ